MEKQRKIGRPKKGFETHAFSLRLPLDLYLSLGHLAVDARISVNELITVAMKEFMEKKPDSNRIRKIARTT